MLSDTTPSIAITYRTDRSLYSRLLQTCLKPFKPKLVSSNKEFPAGSPKLSVPSSARSRCMVEERQVDDVWLYDLKAKNAPSQHNEKANGSADHPRARVHRVYYFAGGSFTQPPSSQHWKMCAAFAATLENTIITIVSHPLAPNSPAPKAVPQLLKLCETLLAQSREADEVVTIGGDSSGGNLALALTIQNLSGGSTQAPDGLLSVCPTTDGSKTNPEIEQLSKIDPLMTAEYTRHVADGWRDSWSGDDPRISPSHADISVLKKHNVRLIGVTAGNDVLSADGLAFRELCIQQGVEGSWLHWEGQMHCFPLAFGYRIRESVESFQWIADQLAQVHERALTRQSPVPGSS